MVGGGIGIQIIPVRAIYETQKWILFNCYMNFFRSGLKHCFHGIQHSA